MLIHSPKELAFFIKNRRKKLKLSQAGVGNQVGLKQQTISEFEINPYGTELDTLFRIFSVLNLEINLSEREQPTAAGIQWREEW